MESAGLYREALDGRLRPLSLGEEVWVIPELAQSDRTGCTA